MFKSICSMMFDGITVLGILVCLVGVCGLACSITWTMIFHPLIAIGAVLFLALLWVLGYSGRLTLNKGNPLW